jgi:4-hydroxybenzoate polyprenyltransferase
VGRRSAAGWPLAGVAARCAASRLTYTAPSQLFLAPPTGDRASGVRTLPVTLGAGPALAAAALAAAGGAAAAALAAGPHAAAAGLAAAAGAARLVQLAACVRRSGFDRDVLSNAIDRCRAPIGVCVLLLAALGGAR